MNLIYKPDFREATERWDKFWNGEIDKRPLIAASISKKKEACIMKKLAYYNACTGNYRAQLEQIDLWLENTIFAGELIPFFSPDHGPDQYAAFYGAKLKFGETEKQTNWVDPVVNDWESFLPQMKISEDNFTWASINAYAEALASHSRGRYLVGICDLHSNCDALSALRGPQNLCMDFYDSPDRISEAMFKIRADYERVYNSIYTASGAGWETGTIGWAPFWCRGKFAVIQCDFICMVSPDLADKYIIPALAEEAAFLDRCVYHLDGPGALRHLDSILAIKDIDVIQWVPGDGQPPHCQWLDLLKKCQSAGKGLQLWGSIDEIKIIHRELRPEKVLYCVTPGSLKEYEDLRSWLEKNT